MRIVFFLIIICLISFENFSCKKSPVAGVDYLLKRALSIYFRDSTTNQVLIGKNGEKFSPDSIKIFTKSNGVIQIEGSTVKDSIGQYGCNFIYYFTIASKEEDFEVVTIDLPDYIYFNSADTDTILIKKQPFTNVTLFWNTNSILSIPALDNRFPYFIPIKK